MATITVPGANSTTVTSTFTGPANTALAQSIATTLTALLASNALTVTNVAGGGTAPAPSGSGTNQLVITSGGVVSVPSGYGFVVDNSGNANLTVSGGSNFLGGNGNLSYTNVANGTGSIVAGNGSDTFNLSGAYTVASGNGNDRMNLSGTGVVSLGGGTNLVSLTGGADTIFAAANAGQTGIVGGPGSVFFYGGNSATQTLDYVVGGSAGNTVVGAANNVVVYASPSAGGASAPGALLVAGTGNETLYGAASITTDQFWGSFSGGNDLMVAGPGNDAMVAGTGNDTLVGGTGNDVFYSISTNLLSVLTKTTVKPGTDFIYNAHPGDTLALTGYDSLYGGAGSAAASVNASLASGSSAITLKDGTSITFVGGSNGTTVFSS